MLRIMHENPTATQKEIATAIGKSERTVKTITVALQEKLIVKRVNGKRNGYGYFSNPARFLQIFFIGVLFQCKIFGE